MGLELEMIDVGFFWLDRLWDELAGIQVGWLKDSILK